MTARYYDIITVGGGIAASSLAMAMAERGARVLVLEREKQFRDRVRGEAVVSWGVAEAHELGIYGLLRETYAHEVPLVEPGSGLRDLRATTLQQLPLLTFPHQRMQEALLAAAENAGAEVRRGVSVQHVDCGTEPAVVVDGGSRERIAARLVIAADGRNSAIRKQTGFPVHSQSNDYYMAGILLANVNASPDVMHAVFNPELGTWTGLIPQAGGQFRAYLTYPKTMGYRLQGEAMFDRFIRESAKAYPPMADFCAEAKSAGPLASFDASDDWVEEAYRDGVALVGDAAATTDPTYGQGLSFALRAARVLRDALIGNSDWNSAGRHYAEQHRRSFQACHTVEGWIRDLFQDPSPKAAALRARSLPLIAEDPSRVPDHIFSGPDLPVNDQVRARLFGEC
ncbi:MAG TPA: NAD(P)/FAD-dependent oxidoreductase [Acidobacteriaceae bacterium]|jgi:2-polyprenyl-6-methoxyphenol hydroxylase-like FAD-dependent oxidoreductase|nr:NAD(P)/FAD-dependent oxidoreductase [Acidobacteriaceae bacterium]